ncbi:hypothetical protein [Legionella sp. PC997]|uniref:hypothetical protein n=1 Tax=Legionella sp. PC997 TaxID=2755562 RepID=UPI0015FDE229|nr:hypothetical protein [Legionella sp. PC997]QMT61533.1 hypothetical protein HBNCFIEN_02937 [Legionella sp. PC997]
MSDGKLETLEQVKVHNKKKVALVDIDGCLIIEGKLNADLVERLRQGGYDEIILFTQRSKFVQSLSLPRQLSEDEIKTTNDAVSHLSEALGKPVKVSTSVDFMFDGPFTYFEQLKTTEELILNNTSNLAKLRSHQADKRKIEELGGEAESARNKLKEIEVIRRRLLTDNELAEIEELKKQLENEISEEKKVVAEYQSTHEEYKTTDVDGYPVNKEQQLINLRETLTQDGSELEEDYFDDNYLNLQELEGLEKKPNRFVVSKGRIMSFEEVELKLSKINDEIATIRSQFELFIRELGIDPAIAVKMNYNERGQLAEPKKTAVINLQKLDDIQNAIKEENSLGKALSTAEFYMSAQSKTNSIMGIKEELHKISHPDFSENVKLKKKELSDLRKQYEMLLKDKFGITVKEASAKDIEKWREPHKTAVTNFQKVLKSENDPVAVYLSKTSVPTLTELKESFRALYITTVYSPANLKQPRDHAQYEVTTDTANNTTDQFKQKYQALKGDRLKISILKDFKSQIEQFTTKQEIAKFLEAYKLSPEYQTLATGQGAFTQGAHKVGLSSLITTSSVDAINDMVEDALKIIEDSNKVNPKG